MKLNTLAPLMLSGALLAPAAQGAKLKTGLEFQFDLGLASGEKDKKVEGDKSKFGFKTRRARWWLSGDFENKFDYKFRFKFKDGSVGLSYVKVGYKLAEGTKVYFGRGYDPIPLISVADDSYRMSDSVLVGSVEDSNGDSTTVKTAAAFNLGDEGVQLVTDVGVGKVKVGIANGAKTTVSGFGETSLSGLALGAAFSGSFGMISPYVGFGYRNVPSEKLKDGTKEFKGRSDMDLSVGAGVDLGATDIYFNYASHTEGEEKVTTGGAEAVARAKKELSGFELKANQKLSDKLEGALHFAQDASKSDGKDLFDMTQIAAQVYMYPYANDNAYFTFSILNATVKPKAGDSSTTNKFILTFSARPSYVIGE